MDIDWHVYRYILLLFLFILSALFSSSEVALFALDKNKINQIKSASKLIDEYLISLLEYPRRLLVTILIGNTAVNVGASILSVMIALDAADTFKIAPETALLIQIVILTFLVLFFGEIIPKVLATKNPLRVARITAIPLYWISVLIYPLAKTLSDLIKAFVSKIKLDSSRTNLSASEFAELADIGVQSGAIEEEEHGLIHGIVSFRKVTVREAMTPRVDIVAVSERAAPDEVMKIIVESGHSRIPLYKNNLDEIVGVIYAKDLLPYLNNLESHRALSIGKLARKTIFVPEAKIIGELMKEFQEKKVHLGIVVDEYGGTAGLVTMEDILEEIVGDIKDEYDKEENLITQVSENSFIALGKTPIYDLNEAIDVNINSEQEDFDTIGGFILNQAGAIPHEGYAFEYDNYRFTVKEIIKKRVNKVLIEQLCENNNKKNTVD